MKLNCIAVDDEPLALRLLEDSIGRIPYLNLVGTCTDAFEAVAKIQTTAVDLIFIDIQMPGMSGLQLIGSLENKPLVIFITAYKQYAIESYDLAVVDYLVKPVSLERFMKACNRAKELFELKLLKHKPENKNTSEYFFLNADYSQVKIMFHDIIWIEGLRDYVKIYLKSNNKPLIVRTSLKAIETELPRSKFIRIHKSYIIAIESISYIRKNSVYIKEMELPVGETFREEIEKLIRKEY